MLYVKLKRLAGKERANTLIKAAIRESRRRARRRPTGDNRPRPHINGASVEVASQVSNTNIHDTASQGS